MIVTVCPPTLIVPLRGIVSVFAATAYETLPDPLPDAADVNVIHGAFDEADQVHDAVVVIVTLPVNPPAGAGCVAGATVYAHAPASCVTVKVCPAIVIVPLRGAGSGFAAAVKPTDPLPDPDAPDVTVIHGAFDVAVHAQPPAAVTLTDPVPPAAGTAWLVDPIEYEQVNASCVTVKVWPSTVIVPDRDAPLFAATEKLTVPLPLPDPPPVTVSQFACGDAVHVQPFRVVTLKLPVPPAADAVWVDGEIE